jgi:putative ABC transport system permease protein
MNLFQLVLKQMRQRSLSTGLTLLSVVLGVALAIAIMILRRESAALFGQTDYGYDVLVGPKGSPLQLVLNTAYHIDRSPGVIPYSVYERLVRTPQYRAMVRMAVPFAVGDTYQNQRIVGTLPKLFGIAEDGSQIPEDRTFEYRPGKRFEIAQGRVFHPEKFEAVIGSDIQKLTGLGLGRTFKATHGGSRPGQTPDEHETEWTVVGVLAPTKTANDRVLFIPLTSFYAIAEHEDALEQISKVRAAQAGVPAPAPVRAAPPPPKELTKPHDDHADEHDEHDEHDDHDHDEDGKQDHAPEDHDDHAHHEAYELKPDGTIELDLPKEQWQVSAVLVRSRSPIMASQLMYQINNGNEAMGVNPASVMREFFRTFLAPSALVWLLVALLVTVVAAVSILVSIYNSVSARLREIAILRALGATRARILTIICLEAALIGLIGGIMGLIVGHLLGAIGSMYLERIMGEGINWVAVDGWEVIYLGAVVLIAVMAGLVPALKAYRTPVATNLVAG